MKLDDYSFELHQEPVDKCHTQCLCHPHFHLSTRSDTTDKLIASYPTVSLTYPHVPDETWNENSSSFILGK